MAIQFIEEKCYNKLVITTGECYKLAGLRRYQNSYFLPDGSLIRVCINRTSLYLFYLKFNGKIQNEQGHWVIETIDTSLFVNMSTNEISSPELYQNAGFDPEIIYKLLCFIYLADNTEVIIKPGRKYGTKKSGKLVNSSSYPITVVNANWNTTSIRIEGFEVRGHFALRWTGSGRQVPKVVFIGPFEKHGYIRKRTKPITLAN